MANNRCTCYVRNLSEQDQFCIRYGSHNPNCSVYRESRDTVDRQADQDFRINHEPLADAFQQMFSGCRRDLGL